MGYEFSTYKIFKKLFPYVTSNGNNDVHMLEID